MPAWILIYWPHFNFVPIFHVHQIWRGTTTHQIRWHSHKKNLRAPGVALKSPANQWGWCCDACEETLTWFIIVIAKEQEGAMNWNSYVSIETGACRLCHVFLSHPPKCCVNINQPSYSLFLFFLVYTWEGCGEGFKIFCTILWIYIYICKLDISTGTVSLQRIYLLRSLKSCLVLPKKEEKKRTNLSALYICYSSFRRDRLLKPSHCYTADCHQIIFTDLYQTFCLLVIENIYTIKDHVKYGQIAMQLLQNNVCNFIVLKVCPAKYR